MAGFGFLNPYRDKRSASQFKIMKKIFLAISLMPIFCIAQDAPKGTNKIIVKGVSYNDAAQALIAKGFALDKTDKDLQLITTVPVVFKKMASSVKLQVFIKDSSAYITGFFKLQVQLMKIINDFEPIVNRGMKGSETRDTFRIMDDFAKSLKGEITYAKQ